MTTTMATLNENRRSTQRQAQITSNVDRIAELERELGVKERELVKFHQVIQSIVNLLKGAGFLQSQEDMVEK